MLYNGTDHYDGLVQVGGDNFQARVAQAFRTLAMKAMKRRAFVRRGKVIKQTHRCGICQKVGHRKETCPLAKARKLKLMKRPAIPVPQYSQPTGKKLSAARYKLFQVCLSVGRRGAHSPHFPKRLTPPTPKGKVMFFLVRLPELS